LPSQVVHWSAEIQTKVYDPRKELILEENRYNTLEVMFAAGKLAKWTTRMWPWSFDHAVTCICQSQSLDYTHLWTDFFNVSFHQIIKLFPFSVNINPYLVEECLISHQAVLECAVVSSPDPLGQVRNSRCSSSKWW